MKKAKNQPASRTKGTVPGLLLLLILTIAVWGIRLSWNQTVQKMDAEEQDYLQENTNDLHDEFERQFAILDGYSASFIPKNIEDHTDLLAKLTRCANKTEFSMVCFIYPDGTLYRNDGVEVQVSHRYYFQEAMQGGHVVSFLENNQIDTHKRVGMAVPVMLNDEIAGVLLGLYDVDGFRALFERTFSDDRTLTYLCDSEGTLLMGTKAAEAFLKERGLKGPDEDGSFMTLLKSAEFFEGSKEQVAEDLQNRRGGHIAYRYDGTMRHTTYIPLGWNDWHILSVLHEDQIYENAMGIAGTFYVVISMALLAVLVVIIYLWLIQRKQAQQARKKSEEIRYLFEHDTLTGVWTEQAFMERVEARMSAVRPGEFCVIYLDFYKFKLINERFTYEKGNELLCALADELSRFADAYNGLCGRINGDHFVLFMPHKQEVIREFGTKKYREQRIIPLELYLHYGIYVIQNEKIPVHQMIDAAKLAQKTVKGNYINCVAYYDDQLKEKQVKEQELITTMAAALEKGEFVPYFQPQYNYRTQKVCGAEALVRWKSPEKGMISPGEFIPLFEMNGFISHVDEAVWEQVCALQRRWLDEGKELCPISINVSRTDLLNGSIVKKLETLLKRYSLTPDALRVEITESAYVDDPKRLIDEINILVERGFIVEMDDFGSGFSSLNMLKDVPFQVLKTDLNFLSATGLPSRRDHILDSVIHMAHGLGMTVIAEGVETQEQADYLLSLNCEYMQGYYFSRPLPIEAYEKLIYGEDV